MIKGLMFYDRAMDEPTAWGDYNDESELLNDFTDMALKSLAINAPAGEREVFTLKIIDPKTRRSTKKYKLEVGRVATLAGVKSQVIQLHTI